MTKVTEKASGVTVTRASVSFPEDVYRTLEQIARAKKVSVAWIVREAAERYISDQWPLLAASNDQSTA